MGVKFHMRGRVQGVGMRFFIQSVARQFALTGYVKNCRDGSVEGVFYGAPAQLKRAIATLKTEHPGHIEVFEQTPVTKTSKEDTFIITY